MPIFTIATPEGRKLRIEAPDEASAVRGAQNWSLQARSEAAKKPYDKAREQIASRTADRRASNERFAGKTVGGFLNGLDEWQTQLARNTGAFDEVAGAMSYLAQGGENLVRRATGKDVEIPAKVALRAAVDHERAEQARYAQVHPNRNMAANLAAIATTGKPTGGPLISKPAQAGLAAAAQTAPFALARQEGGLMERLPGAVQETALSFGLGAGLTAGANKLTSSAASARANPSPARKLAAQGVRLTPGQMVGGAAKRLEDAATSLPLSGASINAARTRGIESFDRVALDRTLAPLGERLPPKVDVGRDGLKAASEAISKAYDDALSGVTIAPDQQFTSEIAAILNNSQLPPSVDQELQGVLKNTILSRFTGAIDGPTWKALDSELGALARSADAASATQPTQRYLKEALSGVRDAHRNLMQRTSPAVFERIAQADEATANLARVRQASQYTGTSARGGVFTPADLNRAAQSMDTSAGNRAFAQGDALMQDLTEPAMQVMPSAVPDSGTPLRGLIGLGAYGGLHGLSPETAATVLGLDGAGAIFYSKPVMEALNAAYRATSPGAARLHLARIEALAARNPQLLPLLEQASAELGLGGKRPVPVGVGEE